MFLSKNTYGEMKKILFYIDTMYRGGAQRVMANLIEYFTEQGYATVLVNDFVQDKSKSQYDLPKNLKRVYLRKDLTGNKWAKNIVRIKRLREVVKEEQPDIVLSFLGRPNKRMLIATLGLKVKKVVSVRNDPHREYGRDFLSKQFARQLFKLADGCVFQTKEAAEYFPESVQRKSTIILNPVGEKFYNVKRSEAPKNIVTVGRMEPQKNQKLLIEAFSKIAHEFINDNLIIYGDGPLRKELETYIEKLGLKDRVLLPGNVSNVEEVLAQAKIFVLPSDYEGMPNALMEAMAVGVPCVSTDCPCGGPRMLLKDIKEQKLVSVGNVKEMTDVLRNLVLDSEMRTNLTYKEKEKATYFEYNNILKQWKLYFDEV